MAFSRFAALSSMAAGLVWLSQCLPSPALAQDIVANIPNDAITVAEGISTYEGTKAECFYEPIVGEVFSAADHLIASSFLEGWEGLKSSKRANEDLLRVVEPNPTQCKLVGTKVAHDLIAAAVYTGRLQDELVKEAIYRLQGGGGHLTVSALSVPPTKPPKGSQPADELARLINSDEARAREGGESGSSSGNHQSSSLFEPSFQDTVDVIFTGERAKTKWVTTDGAYDSANVQIAVADQAACRVDIDIVREGKAAQLIAADLAHDALVQRPNDAQFTYLPSGPFVQVFQHVSLNLQRVENYNYQFEPSKPTLLLDGTYGMMSSTYAVLDEHQLTSSVLCHEACKIPVAEGLDPERLKKAVTYLNLRYCSRPEAPF